MLKRTETSLQNPCAACRCPHVHQATSWALLHQRKNRPNIQINQRQIARN